MTPGLKAWIWLGALALVMGALIFGAAGDLWFWQAWAFLAVFFGASAWITGDLIAHDPALLERRLEDAFVDMLRTGRSADSPEKN